MTGIPNLDRELPAPAQGRVDIYSPENASPVTESRLEQPLVATEKEPQAPPAQIPTPVTDPVSPVPLKSQQPQQAGVVASDDSSQISVPAEDVDVIEKVWVEKAKHVIQANRVNPGMQTIELSKIKAGYLKNRYNKDIKIIEEKK